MIPRKTQEQFEREIQEKFNGEYTVLGKYVNATTKIKIIHNKCGYIYEVNPNNILNGSKCPECSHNKKKTQEQFEKEIQEMYNGEYTVLGNYVNNYTKIEIKHNKCGYIYEVVPYKILNGSKCPECSHNKKKTQEQFDKEVQEKFNGEYTVLGNYVNNYTKIEIKHNKCGYIWEVIPSNILNRGTKCPKCNINKRKTQEQFEKEIQEKFNGEYTVLGNYVNNNTKIKMRHNKCGHIWEIKPTSILNKGTKCPKCKKHNKVTKPVINNEQEIVSKSKIIEKKEKKSNLNQIFY